MLNLFAALPTAQAPSLAEHSDLLQVVVGILFTMVIGYTVYTLKKIDRNQNRLFERLDDVCRQVDLMQGEHNAMVRKGGHRP